jgi:MYXO-CTERM domain-containing protein
MTRWLFCGVLVSALFSRTAWARKPIHAAASETPAAVCTVNFTATGNITYRGGAVVANVHAIPVFWTANVDPAIQAWAEGYLATLADSAHMDLLAEYSTTGHAGGTNQTIGHGTAGPGVVITPSVRGTTINDSNSQIATEIEQQISAGHVPAPERDAQGNPNTIYVVFFPPGTTVNDGTGNSCAAFCAYHGAGGSNSDIIYAVIPDMGPGSKCNTGCSDACTTDNVGVTVGSVSHELAEAITDPVNGWFNPTSQNGSEIGDICASTSPMQTDTGIVPGTTIKAQYEWSQRNRRCLLAPLGADGGAPKDAAPPHDATTPPDVGSPRDAGNPDTAGTSAGGTGGIGAGGSGGIGNGGAGGGSASGAGGAGQAGSGGTRAGSGGTQGGAGTSIGSGGGGASGGGGHAGAAEDAGEPARRKPADDETSGCSCRVSSASRGARSAWALVVLAALAARRRRRFAA